jgi:hypothetical protein
MDPFRKLNHGGVLNVAEIQFNTSFDYMFPLLAANPQCVLPPGATTQGALLALGTAMAMDSLPGQDSNIPAVFIYLGQFIDHDITAQTDREIGVSRIATPDGNVMDLTPLASSVVTSAIVNGRRPQLDMDHLFGDGPPIGAGANQGKTEAGVLYDPATYNLNLTHVAGGAADAYDVPRQTDGTAIIADMRNNENLNVSQLHCAFLQFYNRVAAALPAGLSKDKRYIRARRLVRWAYQYIVLHDYLPNVCDKAVVEDIEANGLRYYSPDANLIFMPLEFSIAAFRFGHSMIRPAYMINAGNAALSIGDMLRATGKPNLETSTNPPTIKATNVISWGRFARIQGQSDPQMSRTIDPLIALGLGTLPVTLPGSGTIQIGPLLQHLARRNLLRGFLLSVPTGQAVATAMDVMPLTPVQLKTGVSPEIVAALEAGNFDTATPLWYYILQEANFQHGGNSLGSVGSRIVAETLIGLVQRDPASFMNNTGNAAVRANGIEVAPGKVIATIADMLDFSGAPL